MIYVTVLIMESEIAHSDWYLTIETNQTDDGSQ